MLRMNGLPRTCPSIFRVSSGFTFTNERNAGCRVPSRRHLEEKVEPQEKENDVRRPACQKRWKLANPAHGFQKLGRRPINDPKSHSESHASHRAARPHQKTERNCQKHAYRREQREGNFLLPLHPESRDVKARPLQPINVIPKLPPAHLERLSNFPVEVTGGLGEFW